MILVEASLLSLSRRCVGLLQGDNREVHEGDKAGLRREEEDVDIRGQLKDSTQ